MANGKSWIGFFELILGLSLVLRLFIFSTTQLAYPNLVGIDGWKIFGFIIGIILASNGAWLVWKKSNNK